MPDPALEDTELQFFELLDIASGDTPVVIKLYSLTGIPRTDRGQRHLNSFYCDFDDLWNNRFDGVIVTGTEPREPDLRDEPYWGLAGQCLRLGGAEHVFDGSVVPGGTRECAPLRWHPASSIA